MREVAVLDADAFARTFTLPELARRLRAIGPRPAATSVSEYLSQASAGRRPSDMLGVGRRPEDEVADPIGRPSREYERTAAELEDLVGVVVDPLFPAASQEQ